MKTLSKDASLTLQKYMPKETRYCYSLSMYATKDSAVEFVNYKDGDIKTLDLEEAIEMLPKMINDNKWLMIGKGNYTKYLVNYMDNEWSDEDLMKGVEGETLLQAVEKMLLYLHKENLL